MDYFLKNLSSDEYLGLELEHFVVKKDTHEFVSYYEPYGVQYVLKQLEPLFDTSTVVDGEYLIGLQRPNFEVSLEPGAQLEVSIVKLGTVQEIYHEYLQFRSEVDPILDRLGYELVTYGYHPTAMANDIPLLPKARYRHMDARFRALGGHGVQMMRGTAAVHVSIDFRDNADFSDKYRVANFIVPILAYMTDNCISFEGQPSEALTRVQIWKDTDVERSGLVPHCISPSFDLQKYTDYLLNINPMFVLKDGELYPTDKTTAEAYKDINLTDTDIEHLLSIVFNFVRLKHYIEIRVADSMPILQTLKYTALLKGIFYSQTNIDSLLHKMQKYTTHDTNDALDQLQLHKQNAIVYGLPIQQWVDELYFMARQGLKGDSDIQYLNDIV